ncbi:cytochrome d ubiquinol oxidase subunit II [Pseudomonas alcaligenes]|jgi:cytochrome d ubiquinol oxidase subunit II|uniref:cytochrome d ubiquinol oxidase subunit II n=1 Tax=Pseudomonadaceae TaxID=135621 RepID=UPI00234E6A9E|nr:MULTISPECIES: cytochrome d ubiquinol oxidase subunit II [Pseudomonas]MDC7824566.1 cytochrome d ubiquinol oxidase subunit II [Pseudomonas sp. BLCC-B13]MEE1949545.1 cytochrome d ubiquinol oxidase subunit II [Pseudomonas alcaligenes]
MFDYESLKLIWWVLVGVLLIGFALTDGFDLGAAALMPFVGRTDNERRVVINTIAPHWDGNQVWLITAGGALFAAWPLVYAASFSGFYWAMLLVLFALFVRPVGFDYRSKLENTRWRQTWDWGLFVGGLVPSLVFGVAFGNLLLGVPFQFDADLRVTYYGSFWQLLNPFGLLAGVVSLSMLLLHGATWLMMRTEADVARRSRRAAQVTALVYLVAFIGAGAWLWLGNIQGQVLQGALDTGAALNPLGKQVAAGNAGWMANYAQYPLTKLAPLLGILGAVLALAAASGRKGGFAFLGSSLAIVGTLCTAGFALFPFIMPSSLDPASSLTVWDAVSSRMTLGIMFVVACIFVPIILAYTLWGYAKMWGTVTTAQIDSNRHGLY